MVDWYGTPKPSYFFLKRTSRPVHVSADFEKYLWKAGETFRADVHLLNDTEAPVSNCRYSIKLMDVCGKIIAEKSGSARTAANRSSRVGEIEYSIPPGMAGRTFFVMAELRGRDGVKISDSVYPIAVGKTDWIESTAGIFEEMNRMPAVDLTAVPATDRSGASRAGGGVLPIRFSNPTDAIAFFIRLRLLEESETLQASYSDNYFTLLPGETKNVDIRAEQWKPGAAVNKARLEVSGWNCPAKILEVNL